MSEMGKNPSIMLYTALLIDSLTSQSEKAHFGLFHFIVFRRTVKNSEKKERQNKNFRTKIGLHNCRRCDIVPIIAV